MPNKRPNEPIGPTNVPGQPLDPKIPPDQMEADADMDSDTDTDTGETDEERQARESENAFDRAVTRIPPG